MKIKKILFKIIIVIYILILIFLFITQKESLYNVLFKTIKLWLFIVFPPIFIFYIISSLLLSTNLIMLIAKLLKPLNKILKFNNNTCFNLFLIGIIVGTPSITSLTMNYYQNNQITKKDVETLIKSASFITPLFILNIFDSLSLGLLIYITHILSNIILVIYVNRKNQTNNSLTNFTNPSFFTLINNLPSVVFLIAILMLFCSTITFVTDYLNIPKIISSFLEISNGINYLKSLNNKIGLLLIVSLISFNGLCIHLQVITILKNSKLYFIYFKYRIVQAMISVIIFILFDICIFHLMHSCNF